MTRTTAPFPAPGTRAAAATTQSSPTLRGTPSAGLLPPWNVAGSVRNQFRKLRAQVCPPGSAGVSLAVCSHDSGEGVSWVASKLACALAEQLRSTVLIDAASQPSQKELFGLPAGQPPLESDATALPAWPTRSPHLTLSVVEPDSERSAEGFEPSLAVAIERERARADVVLVDCRPFASSEQVLQLRGAVDGVLLVVEAERTRREVIGRMLEALQRAQIPVVGVVISKRRRYIPSFIYRFL